jgi:hypothetical protein
MNISKEDAVAHLAKWHNANTIVEVVYTGITGSLSIVGQIEELSPAAIKIVGAECSLLLYFRDTSAYDYKDVRQAPTEANKNRENQYPTFIDVKFNNGDRLGISEHFSA